MENNRKREMEIERWMENNKMVERVMNKEIERNKGNEIWKRDF